MDLDPAQLARQLAETTADLRAFVAARDIILRRRQEVVDSPGEGLYLPRLTEWTGTDAVLGSLDLSIHAMERTVEELKQLKVATDTGRHFRLIEGGDGHEG